MPVTLTYPGVYIEEVPSGIRTITGVATSITAFVGRALRGPVNEQIPINSYADFQRIFGGLWKDSTLSYAVRDFYLNGGSQAIIVRLFHPYFATYEDRVSGHKAAIGVANSARQALDARNLLDTGRLTQADVDAINSAADTEAGSPQNSTEPRKTAAEVAIVAVKAAAQLRAQVKDVKDGIAAAGRFTRANFAVNGIAANAETSIKAASKMAKAAKNALSGLPDDHQLTSNEASNVATATTAEIANHPTGAGNTAATQVKTAADGAATAGATAGSVRVAVDAVVASMVEAAKTNAFASTRTDVLYLEAANEGAWGNNLLARIDQIDDSTASQVISSQGLDKLGITNDDLFNLSVHDIATGATEIFVNVTVKNGPRRIDKVLENESNLVRLLGNTLPSSTPTTHPKPDGGKIVWDEDIIPKSNGVLDANKAINSALLKDLDYTGNEARGIYALKKADLFNLLCIPPDVRRGDTSSSVYNDAMAFCEEKRAMLLVNSPAAWSANKETAAKNASNNLEALGLTGPAARNASLYFPRVMEVDPLSDGQLDSFVPCGIIAGVMARTDTQRGVWKAPAGIDASLNGVAGIEVNLTDDENGMLNPLGINCLRSFPVIGRVVWGARTLRGADQLVDEYKYVPVRRLALFLEESLYRGLKWVVFEPNDEPLWAQIRLNVGAFMHNLFRQGAFQGTTPRDAYFVKCDKETTTQNDINNGIVNVVVGFAPLKPAEFVVIKIQQMAGEVQT